MSPASSKHSQSKTNVSANIFLKWFQNFNRLAISYFLIIIERAMKTAEQKAQKKE
jgi:hypothetical protein